MKLVGGIEGGGTKFVCAVGTGPHDLRARLRIPTTSPGETLDRAIVFFREQAERAPLAAIGIGSFGPLDLRAGSPTWGHITTTPKADWSNVDVAGTVARELGVPVAFDTDVNAAAVGEQRWGAARGLASVVYLTVGTGIGGGVVLHGRPLHGLVHPEIGHLPVPHDREQDPFDGICPLHGDCLEGLACGPAIQARWGSPGEQLPVSHAAWALEADYLALGLAACIYMVSPERIVLGGGVMQQAQLFPQVRSRVRALLSDYFDAPETREGIDGYVVPPALGGDAGVLGAIVLAQDLVSVSGR